MTTIVDLDTGQVLGIVDGRDREGAGEWLFARPLQRRLGVQVVATQRVRVLRARPCPRVGMVDRRYRRRGRKTINFESRPIPG